MRYLSGLFKFISSWILFCLVPPAAFSQVAITDNPGLKIDESVFIADGAEVCIEKDTYISSASFLDNKGVIYFRSVDGMELSWPDGDLGDGFFWFEGGDHSIFVGDGKVGNLVTNTPAGVDLLGDLLVGNSLQLLSGIVNVADGKALFVENPEEGSVLFGNSPSNTSYVIGTLGRNCNTEGTYFFPVGSGRGFHPLSVAGASATAGISVLFDESIPVTVANRWPSTTNDLVPEIGWSISSPFDYMEFNVAPSALGDNNEILQADVDLLFSPGSFYSNYTMVGLRNETNGFYRPATAKTGNGNYVLSNIGQLVLPNFFLISATRSTGSSQFVIPGSDQFDLVRLTVYNRLGVRIFFNDHYSGEFDARNYPSGTYFYELVLEQNAGRRLIRNFIEIKHE
ncbi:gliding motility-associated C-terminal domain-containing protein [Gaoshiqia sp. Z1-71]|uniref:T9SS type B sorting domain-containing protein n=1 Tax=Gaoshiqia hydrogeniformans TaxID=3290090 RepID=UPI003BF88C88